jgi:hypothetical protein
MINNNKIVVGTSRLLAGTYRTGQRSAELN